MANSTMRQKIMRYVIFRFRMHYFGDIATRHVVRFNPYLWGDTTPLAGASRPCCVRNILTDGWSEKRIIRYLNTALQHQALCEWAVLYNHSQYVSTTCDDNKSSHSQYGRKYAVHNARTRCVTGAQRSLSAAICNKVTYRPVHRLVSEQIQVD